MTCTFTSSNVYSIDHCCLSKQKITMTLYRLFALVRTNSGNNEMQL